LDLGHFFTAAATVASLAGVVGACAIAVAEPAPVSAWSEGMHSRARLIAGTVEDLGRMRFAAGVEIDIASDWKTYWRTPGDAGGVPPVFDWSDSTNLARADVLYPAPKVMTDKAGNTIGYKGPVVFPVLFEAVDASKPVTLSLKLEFGVCRDICIPVEALLALPIPSMAPGSRPLSLLQGALDRVPRSQSALRAADPILRRAAMVREGGKAKLRFEASFPATGENAMALVEAPDGLFVPLPRRVAEAGGVITFEAELSQTDAAAEFAGKTLKLTLVGAFGQSEADVTLD